MSTVHVVYAVTSSGERFPLAAYEDPEDASLHVARCKRLDSPDEMTPVELFDLQLYVHPLDVIKRKDPQP